MLWFHLFNDNFKEILFSMTSSRKWPFRWQFQENSIFNDNFKKTISRKWSFHLQFQGNDLFSDNFKETIFSMAISRKLFQGNDLFNYNFKEMTFSITISRKWSFQWQFQGNNIFNDNFMEIVFSMTVSRKLYFQWQFHKKIPHWWRPHLEYQSINITLKQQQYEKLTVNSNMSITHSEQPTFHLPEQLVAFVWLFSNVCFQMSPRIASHIWQCEYYSLWTT